MNTDVGNTTFTCCYGECWMKTDIRITLKNQKYYETFYSYYPKHENCESCEWCNPFAELLISSEDDDCMKEGEIFVKNAMTTEMVKNLLKSKKKLEREIGNTDGSEYKKRILWCISHLWD